MSRVSLVSMVLLPVVCVAVWSTEQFRLQCTLESLQWWQWRDRRRKRVPDFCSGNGEGTVADGLVQRPWNMQRRWRCRSQKKMSLNKCRRWSVCNCQFLEFTAELLWPVHFLLPNQQSGILCLIICAIQLLSQNNLGGTWKCICLPDIQNISALEVLRNHALQIDICLLTYFLIYSNLVSFVMWHLQISAVSAVETRYHDWQVGWVDFTILLFVVHSAERRIETASFTVSALSLPKPSALVECHDLTLQITLLYLLVLYCMVSYCIHEFRNLCSA